MNSKKVFVFSINRPSVYGISEWKTESGKPLNKNKLGRSTDSISALYSPKVGGLANYISYTAYIDPETSLPATDEKGNTIFLQQYLEKKWNKPSGYFTNMPLAPNAKLVDENLTYFQRMSWTLNDGSTMFDLSTMDGELGYYVLLASPYVANSEKEWREHRWPKAQFYIALENESDVLRATKNRQKLKAFAFLENPELSETTLRQMCIVLKLSTEQATLTREQITNLLFDYVDKSSGASPNNIDRILELSSLLSTATGKEAFQARYLIQAGLDTRVLSEKQGTYTFVKRQEGPIVLGERYTEALDFLLNPRKAEEVQELIQAIESSKK